MRRGECVELDPAAEPVDPVAALLLGSVRLPPRTARDRGSGARGRSRCEPRSAHARRRCRRGHASLLHRLSGGLDSSIVAGCLGRASTQPRIACYTYFNPHGRSDERPWARLAAEHAGFEHLEYPIVPAEISLRRPGAPSPRDRAVAAPRLPDAKHGRASTRRGTQGDGRVHRRRRRLRILQRFVRLRGDGLPEAPRSTPRSIAPRI